MCGWIESSKCLEKMTALNWPIDLNVIKDATFAFVQLEKTIPCSECIYTDVRAINAAVHLLALILSTL